MMQQSDSGKIQMNMIAGETCRLLAQWRLACLFSFQVVKVPERVSVEAEDLFLINCGRDFAILRNNLQRALNPREEAMPMYTRITVKFRPTSSRYQWCLLSLQSNKQKQIFYAEIKLTVQREFFKMHF